MRKISYKILYDVFWHKTLLNDAINKHFDDVPLTIKDEDKAFIKREVTGVIEKLDEIDRKIDKFSKVKVKKLNKDVLTVLRLGVYEIGYMDKVPSYATVSECVDIIKKSKNSRLSGYVNAVLREFDRSDIKTSTDDDKIKNCYFRIYHDEEKKVLDELKSNGTDYKPYTGVFDFNEAKVYKVDKYKSIIDTDSFRDGLVLIEDASSIYMTERLSEFLLDSTCVKILDTCSAPGGKILGIVDFLKGRGIKVEADACDVSDAKVSKIKENIDRLKVDCIKTYVKDATIYDEKLSSAYDLVICDVPCTGLGVIDKKPDIKLNYSDDKRDALVEIQRKILSVSKCYVKNGGILSYSTCTETREENEDNIAYFLEHNKDFKMIYEKKIVRSDDNNADGFYMCFMRKD